VPSLQLQFSERFGGVTPVARTAETAAMHIVPTMTIAADLGCLYTAVRRTRMTGSAFQVLVRAIQPEFRPGIVIKSPKCPAVGVMAALAFRSQALLVRIVASVTGSTGTVRSREDAGYMAVLARCDGMLTD